MVFKILNIGIRIVYPYRWESNVIRSEIFSVFCLRTASQAQSLEREQNLVIAELRVWSWDSRNPEVANFFRAVFQCGESNTKRKL